MAKGSNTGDYGKTLRFGVIVNADARGYEEASTLARRADEADLDLVAVFVANERLYCPIFEFGIMFERGGGPVWLPITSEGEAKQILEAEMGVGA